MSHRTNKSSTLPISIRADLAASILGISTATFWRWYKARPDMPRAFKPSLRCTVWDRDELIAWRDTQRTIKTSRSEEDANG